MSETIFATLVFAAVCPACFLIWAVIFFAFGFFVGSFV